MRKFFTMLVAFLLTAGVFAQAPEKISYQAVLRNTDGTLIVNKNVGIKINVMKKVGAFYQIVYEENHTSSTNENGLVSLKIGDGAVVQGSFADIEWWDGSFFLWTNIDPTGGTNYTISGSSQLLSVPFALHAKTAETVTGNAATYSVGDFAHGGIVFWVDETGQHGLVCAKEDQSDGVRWYAGTNGKTQAKGNGPYAGKANTSIIIAAQVAIGDDGSTYAARICNELKITENGISYGDWYLPSMEELNLMYQNRATIDATAALHGGSGFAGAWYTCSTEYDAAGVFSLNFSNGVPGYGDKSYADRVRAVRAF